MKKGFISVMLFFGFSLVAYSPAYLTEKFQDQSDVLTLENQIRINTAHISQIDKHAEYQDVQIEKLKEKIQELQNSDNMQIWELNAYRWVLGISFCALFGNLAAMVFSIIKFRMIPRERELRHHARVTFADQEEENND